MPDMIRHPGILKIKLTWIPAFAGMTHFPVDHHYQTGLTIISFWSNIMPNLKFHPEHAWVAQNGDQGTIGISDYAQQQLGEIIYVDLPEIDTEIQAGEPFCALESNKVATDVIAPVSGLVIETNGALDEEPNRINASPYESGWLIKISVKNQAEVDGLMDQKAYEQYIASK
jgi:glycine cleavage system H protein